MPESKSNSHTEQLADGNIGAWYTDENDEERYLGAFKDERHAQFAIDGALETAEFRRSDKPTESQAKAPPAKKTTS